MKTFRRSLTGLILGGALCVVATMPAQAGYGNHAERATANIQTRVGLAKITLISQVNQFDVVAARGGFPPPPPQP